MCYYSVLGVPRTASQDEIKAAYRKLARVLHPDKCESSQQEEYKKKFQQLGEAYGVLHDPQERAWYDSHRQKILEPHKYEDGDPVELLLEKLEKRSREGNDAFFAALGEAFLAVAVEEENARVEQGLNLPSFLSAPRFGDDKSTPESVLKFYDYWEHFTSCREFAWADEFDPRDEPERRIKRLIEQENKRVRNAARKAYQSKVLALLSSARQRDYRLMAILEEKRKERLQKEKEEQALKVAREAEWQAKKQALLQQEFEEYKGLEKFDHLEAMLDAQGEEDRFDCLVCEKSFKSQNQLNNHLKSKDHIKKYKKLVEEVGEIPEVDIKVAEKVESPPKKNSPPVYKAPPKDDSEDDWKPNPLPKKARKTKNDKSKADTLPQTEKVQEDKNPKEKDQARAKTSKDKKEESAPTKAKVGDPRPEDPKKEEEVEAFDSEGEGDKKISKKEKKVKKAKEKEDKEKIASMTCRVCQFLAPSKTKLFDHLKTEHKGKFS